jgi:hypothetical protein
MTSPGTRAFLCTYLLPIRRISTSRQEIENLSEYFRELAQTGCEVLVVDGSPAEIFDEHHRAWREVCRHVMVDPKYTYLNGKVNGVHTGVELARSEYIVLADDDIRYTAGDIARARELLGRYDMVRPQNYLAPLPWWGRTEAARMLINRGVLRTGDYPGTCAFRRSTCLRVGHYDGDVLFDNEEIVRHFAINGANVCFALDFFVLKRPPGFRKWLEQRPRQAYEDFAMRVKTAFFMAVVPATAALGMLLGTRAGIAFLSFLSVSVVLLGCRGLWRDAAYRVYPAGVVLYAPLWLAERALSVYWALYWRIAHGGYPFGGRMLAKGTGRAWVAGGSRMRAGALSDRH